MLRRRRLFIIGAGPFGIDLAYDIENDPAFGEKYDLCGFLHHGKPQDLEFTGLPLAGDWVDFRFGEEDAVLLGTTDIAWKMKIVESLAERAEIISYVHPSFTMQSSTKVGAGCVIMRKNAVSHKIIIGDFVTINPACRIGHGCVIGKFSSLFVDIDLGGNVHIGERVLIGTKAAIAPGVKIGNDAKVGIGSVVISHVEERETVMGNPARVIFGAGE